MCMCSQDVFISVRVYEMYVYEIYVDMCVCVCVRDVGMYKIYVYACVYICVFTKCVHICVGEV